MLRVWAVLFLLSAVPVEAGPFGDYNPVDFGPRGPASYAVHGIDVARYQGEIDWRRVRASGVAFAYIKATEGGDLKDSEFDRNWQLAAREGVPRGAYHFYYFCTDPEVQARWFIRNVPRRGHALPPVLDLEWNPFSPTCTVRPPGPEVRRQARIFLDIVERHYGKRPIIYTTPEFYAQTGIGEVDARFWLRSVARTPDRVYPGKPWVFWQYTGTGVVPGVAGGVDINVSHGTSGDWRRWLGRHNR
jgi:lysozyme